ncbi:hypothetical protein FJY70_04345 [candidate division WOR-3 bacterium]|nr:hypothetical protein [candidate division WOR-3 bacterium]
MNRQTSGELARVANNFLKHCEVVGKDPTPRAMLQWLAEPKLARFRCGWSLMQAGEEQPPVQTGRPE